jgi:DNA-binding NtrC family response regulator
MTNHRGNDGTRTSAEPIQTIRKLSSAVVIPRLELIVEREAGEPRRRVLELEGDALRVGSHPSNDVVLEDPLVSRFHCTLTRTDMGWSISDTGSVNGTGVNGVRVRDADLPLPICHVEVGDSVLRVRELRAQAVDEVPTWSSFGELYGESLAMRRLFGVLNKVSQSDSTVLIEGESGTGKELAATEIARRSTRGDKAFFIIDCGAISPNVIESELFGHARGAFTGADRARVGAFEAADSGTVFLDEIGELPLEMQPKLLRALEAREIRRVGENEPRKIDVRVIAATHRRLESEVNSGRFREDLYFRLSVVRVAMPPLRKRLEDLPLLIHVLLRSMNAEESLHLFSPQVIDQIARHDWPGNVRELRNYVERTVVLEHASPGPRFEQFSSLPPPHRAASAASAAKHDVPFKVAKDEAIAQFENRYLTGLMDAAGGNVSRAARLARMDRMYLHRLLQRYGLKTGSIKD